MKFSWRGLFKRNPANSHSKRIDELRQALGDNPSLLDIGELNGVVCLGLGEAVREQGAAMRMAVDYALRPLQFALEDQWDGTADDSTSAKAEKLRQAILKLYPHHAMTLPELVAGMRASDEVWKQDQHHDPVKVNDFRLRVEEVMANAADLINHILTLADQRRYNPKQTREVLVDNVLRAAQSL